MKNLNYFPFERNRYYYGKLLTEQDFNQEQKYGNDKRRFINRFLSGTGVAAGFKVVAVGEKSISVEAGMALDFAGREILLAAPVNRNLSMIDGFDTAAGETKDYLYLGIEYDERTVSPSLNITGTSSLEGEGEADRIKESCHLYLTEEEPNRYELEPESMYRQEALLYEQDQIFVRQMIPAAAASGEEFEMIVELENLGPTRKVSLEFTEELTGLFAGAERVFRMEEKELILECRQKVRRIFSCRAMALDNGKGKIVLKPGSLLLSVGSRTYRGEQEQSLSVPILKEDLWELARAREIEGAMDQIRKYSYPQGIYLARIYLIKTGGTYLIDKIDQNPFRQYVENVKILSGYIRWLHEELQALRREQETFKRERLAVPDGQRPDTEKKTEADGVVTLDLGIGGKRGQRVFSEEIYHGLGLGNVDVFLSVAEGDKEYTGSGEVFEEMKVKAELAARTDRARGSFMIGARLIEPTSERSLKVRWRAALQRQARGAEAKEQKLYIRPGVLELKVRESFYLETESVNMLNPSVIWSVKTKEGGMITAEGLYTAPNIPGVYEVHAQSEENPQITASLFVIVRQ